MGKKLRNKKQEIKWAIESLTELKNNFLNSFDSIFDLGEEDVIFINILNRNIKLYEKQYAKLAEANNE